MSALLHPVTSLAATTPSLQEKIDVTVSPNQDPQARVEAANALTEGWQDSLPVLIQNLDSYYKNADGRPYSDDAVPTLIPLSDLLVTIVVNKDGAVQKFREVDTAKTIDLLAWAAGGDDRDLRFNASYILAKVVDDDNLCIVLHKLRENAGYTGQINLLQIAISASSSAARENVTAAKATADILKRNTEGKPAILVNLLSQITSARQDVAEPLPPDSYCARYDVDSGLAGPEPAN